MQEEVTRRLQEIGMRLKALPNVGSAYVEYISALIYVISKNIQDIERVLNSRDIYKILGWLDVKLEEIRIEDSSQRLFENIRFKTLLNDENYIALENVIIDLVNLIAVLKGTENLLAESFEDIIEKAAQNNELSSGKRKVLYS